MRGLSLGEGLDRFGNVRLRMRLLTRAVARSAWVKSGSKGEDALIQIAILLWKYWHENKIDVPSVVPSSLEPVDYETEDADADD